MRRTSRAKEWEDSAARGRTESEHRPDRGARSKGRSSNHPRGTSPRGSATTCEVLAPEGAADDDRGNEAAQAQSTRQATAESSCDLTRPMEACECACWCGSAAGAPRGYRSRLAKTTRAAREREAVEGVKPAPSTYEWDAIYNASEW